jgi:CheY-like chemotaxis protein
MFAINPIVEATVGPFHRRKGGIFAVISILQSRRPLVIFGIISKAWNKPSRMVLPSMDKEQLDKIPEPIALVVDDEPLIRMDIADIISDAGYHVVEAATADEALAFLEKYSSLQLLFTDVQTGSDLDGFELARKIAERWPNIEVVVASGARVPKEGELPGNASFIRKPFSAETVLETLQEHFPDGPSKS